MDGTTMVDTRGLFVSFSNLGTQLAARTNFTLTASSISQQTLFISLRRSQRIYVQQSIAAASVSSFLTLLRGTWSGNICHYCLNMFHIHACKIYLFEIYLIYLVYVYHHCSIVDTIMKFFSSRVCIMPMLFNTAVV